MLLLKRFNLSTCGKLSSIYDVRLPWVRPALVFSQEMANYLFLIHRGVHIVPHKVSLSPLTCIGLWWNHAGSICPLHRRVSMSVAVVKVADELEW